jgi:hypothetical protein
MHFAQLGVYSSTWATQVVPSEENLIVPSSAYLCLVLVHPTSILLRLLSP